MDWKRLVQFALLGSSDLEQYAILLVRISLGLFFAISGANNCLSPAARKLFPGARLNGQQEDRRSGTIALHRMEATD